jgi:hypothetical protein
LEVVTTVTTSPFPFDFVFVPRIASNRKKVRFGEFVVQKQISVLRYKNCEKSQNRILICTFGAHAPGYYLTFVSFALFDLSNRGFSKNRPLPVVLF